MRLTRALSGTAEILQTMGNKKGRSRAQTKGTEEIRGPEVLDEKIKNIRRIGWAVIGIYLALFGGLITWYLPNQLSNLRELVKGDTAAEIEPIQRQLDRIQGKLSDLSSLSSAETLEKLSRSGPQTLAASLSQLHRAIQESPEKVNAKPQTLQAITRKLRTISSASPDYWPTVLKFIQFASHSMVKPSNVPPPGRYIIISQIHCKNVAHCLVISHRAVELDGGSIPGSIFDHCRIKFTNNPVGLAGCQFKDCVFEMPTSQAPSPYLKHAARSLLAGNITDVTFPQS